MSDSEKLKEQEELAGIEEFLKAYPDSPISDQLKTRKEQIQASLFGTGAISQGYDSKAIGEKGVLVEGSIGGDIVTGTKIEIATSGPKPLPLGEALQRYLDNLIASHQHLRLQGIRAGSQPLSVALEKVFISLTATDKRITETDKRAPDSLLRKLPRTEIQSIFHIQPAILTIAVALEHYRRLVVIGDPGCGKTTLLSYLTLTYARDLRDGTAAVKRRLSLDEADHLPILLPLRDLGSNLKEKHSNAGKDGPALLLDFLQEYYLAQNIPLPINFFASYLDAGKAVLLLDGLDEVADVFLRQRLARLIEKFVERYPKNRFVVTSREVGYEGAARLSENFGLAKVRDFTPAEVRQFTKAWTRAVETTLAQSSAPEIIRLADAQAENLIKAIETNPRVADLALNPLLLTVIALVHRYRAQLPERRSELYEEAIEVLLGHWDEAKGLNSDIEVAGIKMDSGDRRSLLEPIAFWAHEHKQREIERDDLHSLLLPTFKNIVGIEGQASKALDNFLHMVNERSGLLIERGTGIYGFAHLTFQEYLAARALADRKDALDFTLNHLGDSWWREVILLQAGYLSTQGKRRVSEMINGIMNADIKTEPEPHHHLLLAAECLFDVGPARVEGDLLGEVRRRLREQADAPIQKGNRLSVLQKANAMNALARIESGQFVAQYWKLPWGEPEWISIPDGEFWMGGSGQFDGKPVHKIYLPEYRIARVPVTNAQYAIFIKDTGAEPPEHWRGGQVPKGYENHPVVYINRFDATSYCAWLSEKIGKSVTLPSESEWEKAARGSKDIRDFPWGDWSDLHANTGDLTLGDTTSVDLFLNGASPYGVLDMSGNVWEWTRGFHKDYPYKTDENQEELKQSDICTLRGGSFSDEAELARCAIRLASGPLFKYGNRGFRIVISSLSRK